MAEFLSDSQWFRPLAQLLARANDIDEWVIDPSEVASVAKRVANLGAGVLRDSLGPVGQTLSSFQSDRRLAASFLFELSVGVIESVAGSPGMRFSKTDPRRVRTALRHGYEEAFEVGIEDTPSWKHLEKPVTREFRQELDQQKRLIWDLAMRPLRESVTARMDEEVHLLTRMQAEHPLAAKPCVLLDSPTDFQASARALARWLKQAFVPLDARSLDLDLGCVLAGIVQFRKFAEEGQLEAAYAKAPEILPGLSRTRRAEFERCLTDLKMSLRIK